VCGDTGLEGEKKKGPMIGPRTELQDGIKCVLLFCHKTPEGLVCLAKGRKKKKGGNGGHPGKDLRAVIVPHCGMQS